MKIPTDDVLPRQNEESDPVVINLDEADSTVTSNNPPSSPSFHISPSHSIPNHPDPATIPPKKTKLQIYNFQKSWFVDYPWLSWDESKQGVICHTCHTAENLKMMELTTKTENAFVKDGFRNWKKGKAPFLQHYKSDGHQHATYVLAAQQTKSISTHLSTENEENQKQRRRFLLRILRRFRFLMRQGIPARNHDKEKGNLYQLLKMDAEDDDEFRKYLETHTSYSSWSAQQEFAQDLSHNILRRIAKQVKENAVYSIIMDGTQDMARMEQVSIHLRHVDSDLVSHKDFIGLYSTTSTTGADYARVAKDVLLRLGLKLDDARGQTYDGASNMAGKEKGCGVLLKKDHPLILQFHCQAHAANLVVQAAADCSDLTRKALAAVHDLSKLSKDSIKVRQVLTDTCKDSLCDSPAVSTALRPLCPTRWLCRYRPIKAVIDHYPALLSGLQKILDDKLYSSPTNKARVEVSRNNLRNPATYLGLTSIIKPFALIEQLSITLQV